MGRRSRKRMAAAQGRDPRARDQARREGGRTAAGGGAPGEAEAPAAGGSRAAGRMASGAAARPTAGGRPGLAPRGAAPAAPWAPFPLIELAILVALVLIGIGLATHGGRGRVLLGCGLGLVTVATLELTVREHFAGYRSHASLLAGAGSVAAAVVLYAFTKLPQPVPLAVAAAVFGTLWRLLRGAYRRARASTGVDPTPGPAGPTVAGGRRARLR